MTVGAEYLNRKRLTFDLWRESIKDGRKGDILVLLGLNYLMGTHTMVHLHGNRLWTTLQETLNHDKKRNVTFTWSILDVEHLQN